jgi:hypothetical protein
MLLTILLLTITTGCVSKPKAEIVLPPEPQREELPEVRTIEDLAYTINYYEHLVQSWEAWADSVKKIINVENPSQSGQ